MNNILNDFMTFNPCSSDPFVCRWKILNLKREIITNVSVQDLKKITGGIRTSVGMAFFSLECSEGSMDGHLYAFLTCFVATTVTDYRKFTLRKYAVSVKEKMADLHILEMNPLLI